MSYSFDLPPGGAPHLEPCGRDDQLVLVKQGVRYVFDCAPGDEPRVIEQLQAMVADPNNDFNWFDAAVVSHQMGQRMSDRLSTLYRNKRPA